jgi:hypothetical protein
MAEAQARQHQAERGSDTRIVDLTDQMTRE